MMESPQEGHHHPGPQRRQHDSLGYFEGGTPVHTPLPMYASSFQDAQNRPSNGQQKHNDSPGGWQPMPPSFTQYGGGFSGQGPRKPDQVTSGPIGVLQPRRWRLLRHFPWIMSLAMIASIACKCPSRDANLIPETLPSRTSTDARSRHYFCGDCCVEIR